MDSGHEDKNINMADAEQTSASQQENEAMAGKFLFFSPHVKFSVVEWLCIGRLEELFTN